MVNRIKIVGLVIAALMAGIAFAHIFDGIGEAEAQSSGVHECRNWKVAHFPVEVLEEEIGLDLLNLKRGTSRIGQGPAGWEPFSAVEIDSRTQKKIRVFFRRCVR